MPPFFGYPGQAWAIAYISLQWLAAQIAAGVNAIALASAAQATYATVLNAIEAVGAYQTFTSLQAEAQNLAAVEALPVSVDPTTIAFFNTRLNGVTSLIQTLSDAVPTLAPQSAITSLNAGSPAVPDPGLLLAFLTFNGEDPPTGVTCDATTLADDATQSAATWMTLVHAIAVFQGKTLTAAYDTAVRNQVAAQDNARRLAAYSSGPFNTATSGATLWSQMIALPTILTSIGILNSAPSSLMNQQCGTIRYVLGTSANQLALFLMSLRQSTFQNINVASVLQNDTPMDIAARALGDFKQWQNIVAANSLAPPWTGPGTTAPQGTELIMPTGTAATIVTGLPAPSYAVNFLGTDLDFGPINGSMPVWAGDYNLITGYGNYARALGRRIQTTLGTLLYHSDYGSRIPPEVGAVQTADTAIRIAAYGQSAIATDSRTAKVLSATATSSGYGLVSFSATAQPKGFNSPGVLVNEVLAPNP